MECKYQRVDCFDYRVKELIDTLWNVNDELSATFLMRIKELIDTLWNVNLNEDGMEECNFMN